MYKAEERPGISTAVGELGKELMGICMDLWTGQPSSRRRRRGGERVVTWKLETVPRAGREVGQDFGDGGTFASSLGIRRPES